MIPVHALIAAAIGRAAGGFGVDWIELLWWAVP
jgi:hypothetical protein